MLSANNQTNSIPVYQALDQTEKVTNKTSRPDLVYSQLTTIDLLLRQVKKDGIGLIFSQHYSAVETAKKVIGIEEVLVSNYTNLQESVKLISREIKIIVVSLKPGTTIRISDIESTAKSLLPPGHNLKWITILQQPGLNQLFKWELKYNSN